MNLLTNYPEWSALQDHQHLMSSLHMRDFFISDPKRFERFSLEHAGLFLDYSKNRIIPETLQLLLALAERLELKDKIQHLFSGHIFNHSEKQHVLHTALRSELTLSHPIDDSNIHSTIAAALEKMSRFCDEIYSGAWCGFTGKKITDIVNIGIGGSELGPALVIDALKLYATGKLRCHFISNVDGAHVLETLSLLNPETTLFIVTSKSFKTTETLTNAKTVQHWLEEHLGSQQTFYQHFIAITAYPERALNAGFKPGQIFTFGAWVGGRYSLWSSVGLPIALMLGMKHFKALLKGAQAMDEHFRSAPLAENMPVILALLGIWYINFFDCETHAIIPYCHALKRFPLYIQQLDMESNGKCVNQEGQIIHHHTAPIIWGDCGSNSQHSFHQLLHQGSRLVPVDFLVATQGPEKFAEHQALLFASCLGQSHSLMHGKTQSTDANSASGHQITPGNKPTNTLVFEQLTPVLLGALLALYEHKIFVQGMLWDINSFDQWGIESSKAYTAQFLNILKTTTTPTYDSSTNGLIHYFQKNMCS